MLSRRQFLTLAGITVLGLPAKSLLGSELEFPAHYGRALDTLIVHREPHSDAPIVSRVWSDSVFQLLERKGDWLRIPEGFVQRAYVQAMLPYTPETSFIMPNTPFWAETAAPVAPIHAWCAADAPILVRVGHGAVMRVVDALPTGWYAVELGTRRGWSQAVFWHTAPDGIYELGNARVEISLSKHMLYVHDDQRLVMTVPIVTGQALKTGVYHVQQRRIGGTQLVTAEDKVIHGIPWRIGFDAFELMGAYWHNSFGTSVPGSNVQISPLVARWLYRQMLEGSTIIVTR